MNDFIVLILGAALPSAILLVWFYRKDRARPEPLGLLGKSVLLGFVAAVPAILLELASDYAGTLAFGPENGGRVGLAWLLRILWTSFVTAALIEESIKFFFVKTFAYRKAAFNEVTDGIVYAVCVSLGFAFAENILYGMGDHGVLVLRAFTAVPMHAAAAGVMGYWLGMAKRQADARNTGAYLRKGLAQAVLIHGAYDCFLFLGGFFPALAMVVLIASCLYLGRLLKKAKALDEVAFSLKGDPGR